MDIGSILTIIAIAILILFSGFLGAVEIAFVALNRIRIKTMAEEGSKRAKLTLRLYEDYDNLLSTCLVLNNIALITAASISTLLFVRHFDDYGTLLSTIVITIVALIFGDITPRSMAKASADRFALFASPIMHWMIVLLFPINWIFAKWKLLMGKIFKAETTLTYTEEEILSIVDEAEEEGAIDEEDMELIHSVIEFNDLFTEDILTPRTKIVGAHDDVSIDELAEVFLESGHSRIPLYKESLDDITGIVHMRDFLQLMIKRDQSVADIITPPTFAAPSMKISDLFKMMQKQKVLMVIVTDEYGGTAGMVTMEDILEELVGDIWDEFDEVVEDIVLMSDGEYRVLCSASIDDLFEELSLDEDEDIEAHTVGGWIMDKLEHIPEVGDNFIYRNLSVTITKADDKMALECVITVTSTDTEEERHQK
ncbi:MAG: hemolysin family protein [Oscillospiraceae bacterium]|nr:hemolysin family protein [Oscillospiraceae bacterium]